MSPKSGPAQTPSFPASSTLSANPSTTTQAESGEGIFQALLALLHPEVSFRNSQLPFQTQPMSVRIYKPQYFRSLGARQKGSSSVDTVLEPGFRGWNLARQSLGKRKAVTVIPFHKESSAYVCVCARKRQGESLKNIDLQCSTDICVCRRAQRRSLEQ